jgi:hypothetical protein
MMSVYVCVHVLCSCNVLSGSALFDVVGHMCSQSRDALLRLALGLRRHADIAFLQAEAS